MNDAFATNTREYDMIVIFYLFSIFLFLVYTLCPKKVVNQSNGDWR